MTANAQSAARLWLERIHALPQQGRVKIMNVCGGHERSITMAGLRKACLLYTSDAADDRPRV